MVIRKISYYRVIVSLCLFMFLLSPVFGDENSAVSFDKELPKNNIVTIQPDSLRILHNPLTGWVLYASMGVDAADFWAQYDHCLLYTSKLRPGDIRYRDVNGDGKVDVFDKSPIGGTKDPEIVYGFGLNMKYKDLDFGALFQGIGRSWNILGSSIIPGANRGVTGNMFTNANDRWTVDNPSQNVFYPRLDDGINSNNNQPSTWWLRNMSFLRLKNIELGYSLPKNLWRNTTVISGIRLFVRGTNLLTFSKFDLWDPEVENTTGAAYPIMKSLSAGFEIKF